MIEVDPTSSGPQKEGRAALMLCNQGATRTGAKPCFHHFPDHGGHRSGNDGYDQPRPPVHDGMPVAGLPAQTLHPVKGLSGSGLPSFYL